MNRDRLGTNTIRHNAQWAAILLPHPRGLWRLSGAQHIPAFLCSVARSALLAENLFLRKQLAFYQVTSASGVTQKRPCRVTSKPAMLEAQDRSYDWGAGSLGWHGQCLERNETTAGNCAGAAGMVATADWAGNRSPSGDGGRLSESSWDCGRAPWRLEKAAHGKTGHAGDHRLRVGYHLPQLTNRRFFKTGHGGDHRPGVVRSAGGGKPPEHGQCLRVVSGNDPAGVVARPQCDGDLAARSHRHRSIYGPASP